MKTLLNIHHLDLLTLITSIFSFDPLTDTDNSNVSFAILPSYPIPSTLLQTINHIERDTGYIATERNPASSPLLWRITDLSLFFCFLQKRSREENPQLIPRDATDSLVQVQGQHVKITTPPKLQGFTNDINTVDPYIIFTMEDAKNNKIAFLDCVVTIKTCGNLEIVYRKPIQTDQSLLFDPKHPL